jgi:hypothetical protein
MDAVAEEAPGADSIADQNCPSTDPKAKISVKTEESLNQQEIERRREIVRRFFNDFWRSSDDKGDIRGAPKSGRRPHQRTAGCMRRDVAA